MLLLPLALLADLSLLLALVLLDLLNVALLVPLLLVRLVLTFFRIGPFALLLIVLLLVILKLSRNEQGTLQLSVTSVSAITMSNFELPVPENILQSGSFGVREVMTTQSDGSITITSAMSEKCPIVPLLLIWAVQNIKRLNIVHIRTGTTELSGRERVDVHREKKRV